MNKNCGKLSLLRISGRGGFFAPAYEENTRKIGKSILSPSVYSKKIHKIMSCTVALRLFPVSPYPSGKADGFLALSGSRRPARHIRIRRSAPVATLRHSHTAPLRQGKFPVLKNETLIRENKNFIRKNKTLCQLQETRHGTGFACGPTYGT